MVSLGVVFGQQVVKRLVATGSLFLGNRLPPFLGAVVLGVDIDNDTAEFVEAVTYYLADRKLCIGNVHNN